MAADALYEKYKANASFVSTEICLNGIIAVICFIGICLNLSLVLVTIKTKSLRSPCSILIALYAFLITFLYVGFSVKFFVFLFGINFISLAKCFTIQFIPMFATGSAVSLELCIGIERLFGVLWPIWYKIHAKSVIYKCLIICCLIPTMFSLYFIYVYDQIHWDKQVMCTPQDPGNIPEMVNFINYSNIFTNFAEFTCYAFIWLIIWRRKTQTSIKSRKLLCSLSIIMSIELLCYVMNIFFFTAIMPHLNLDIFTIEYTISTTLTSAYLLAHCSTMPILFISSTHYRQAIQNCCFGSSRQVQVMQQVGYLNDHHNRPMNVVVATNSQNQ